MVSHVPGEKKGQDPEPVLGSADCVGGSQPLEETLGLFFNNRHSSHLGDEVFRVRRHEVVVKS